MHTRPSWATTVAIFMILFAGCGAVNNLKMINTNEMEEMAGAIIDNMETELESEKLDSTDIIVLETFSDSVVTDSSGTGVNLAKTIKGMMHMTDYFKLWSVRLGWAGLIIAILFLISGILFFYKTKFTIPIAIGTLIASLLYAALKVYIYSKDNSSSYILAGMEFSSYFSMFIDVIMLTVIMVVDKSFYQGVSEDSEY
ncbi:MAG: hypothetical protein HKN67_07395 [Saprospiraceae bacterium]|nr:hypothetical protein [Bacteroidia bacterium]MBT8229970.1 hypothetical protein [Bacteroidia bacterium]NNF21749.1 hypothetical protein [Saprospiraceae bacterium]